MRLALSSAAAPDALPNELVDSCVRRGMSGLELASGGLGGGAGLPLTAEALELAAGARPRGVEIVGIFRERLLPTDLEAAACVGAALRAPIVVPVEGFDRSMIHRAAEVFARAGARLLIGHGGDPRVAEAIRWLIQPIPHNGALGMAWAIRPGADDSRKMRDVLEATGGALQYVRLHGGGPESQAQAGMGIGPLMARLTLARYRGPLVLTPSNTRFHYAWSAWLGRAGGWGCGSKHSDRSLISLNATIHAGDAR